MMSSTKIYSSILEPIKAHNLSYAKRSEYAHNRITQRLFELMERKQTNLALAADVMTKKELLVLADAAGPFICMLKLHCDIIADFDSDLIQQLQILANKHEFFICEDRKFADIGNTVQAQYLGGIYHIGEWADIIIAHAISGPGLIQALGPHKKAKEHGILLIAQLSSEGSLIDAIYTQKVRDMARENATDIIGFIAQEGYDQSPEFITMTPGVNLQESGDSLGQQYNSPEAVIAGKMSDVIIVGRGICQAKDPGIAAQKYRDAGWKAYQTRLIGM